MAAKDIEKHKFQKGQTGNPNGRPKGKRNRATVARQWLEVVQNLKNPLTGTFEDLEQQDLMTLALINKARKGDVQAYNALMDSGYGKATQAMELSGKDGAPIIVKAIPDNI